MATQWTPLPLDQPLFANVDEDAVVGFSTAIENGYQNEFGGHSRFPGLVDFVDLPDNGRVILHDWNGDMIAATSKGQMYRIDRTGNVKDVTGVPISGGRRTIFAKTDREILAAAGGAIVRLRTDRTEILSEDAPQASHVGWIDGFTIAAEINSNRWQHSAAGEPDSWDPLDVFSADGSPDNINSLMVTPFREIMIGGPESMEQFESTRAGDTPFFRRWSTGDGVAAPYCMVFADNALWTINKLYEFVRTSGQVSQAMSSEIGKLLESVDDWSEAWIGGFPDNPLHIVGQKFIVIQAPNATNAYGTKGLTFLFDYRNRRWYNLYGWDIENGIPVRWPGWSHWPLWGKVFVGGEGKIYELKPGAYRNSNQVQRWLTRTAHISEGREIIINRMRLRMKRGIGGNVDAPRIQVRCSRNGKPFGSWITRTMGQAGSRIQTIEFGAFGAADTHQFEIMSTDDAEVELLAAEIQADAVGH